MTLVSVQAVETENTGTESNNKCNANTPVKYESHAPLLLCHEELGFTSP